MLCWVLTIYAEKLTPRILFVADFGDDGPEDDSTGSSSSASPIAGTTKGKETDSKEVRESTTTEVQGPVSTLPLSNFYSLYDYEQAQC
jgi:hypothetical protein